MAPTPGSRSTTGVCSRHDDCVNTPVDRLSLNHRVQDRPAKAGRLSFGNGRALRSRDEPPKLAGYAWIPAVRTTSNGSRIESQRPQSDQNTVAFVSNRSPELSNSRSLGLTMITGLQAIAVRYSGARSGKRRMQMDESEAGSRCRGRPEPNDQRVMREVRSAGLRRIVPHPVIQAHGPHASRLPRAASRVPSHCSDRTRSPSDPR